MSEPVIVWTDGRKRGRSACFLDDVMIGRVRWDRRRNHWLAELRAGNHTYMFAASPIGYFSRERAKEDVEDRIRARLCAEVETSLLHEVRG